MAVVPSQPVGLTTKDWSTPKFPVKVDATPGQTPGPGMMGTSRPSSKMNQPTNLAGGGFRDPNLMESGNPRVPINKYPSQRQPPQPDWSAPRFDAVPNPHPPVDPIAEACEYAAGITGNPTDGENANNKNDHAKAQVFHERMARFHQARHEDDHAAAHMAASGAHQQAARLAGDKVGYRRGITVDQLGTRARDCSVRANHLSGFGRGHGDEGQDGFTGATDPPVSEAQRRAMGAAAGGNSTLGIPQSVGKEFVEADPGGKLPQSKGDAGVGRYQLVDRQTGDCYDVAIPQHVQFSKDVGGAEAPEIQPRPLEAQPLKPRELEPRTMRGSDQGGWGTPSFPTAAPADAGTSEGARKAAQTRARGGGAKPTQTQTPHRPMSEQQLQQMGHNFMKGGMPPAQVFQQMHQYRQQHGMPHPGSKTSHDGPTSGAISTIGSGATKIASGISKAASVAGKTGTMINRASATAQRNTSNDAPAGWAPPRFGKDYGTSEGARKRAHGGGASKPGTAGGTPFTQKEAGLKAMVEHFQRQGATPEEMKKHIAGYYKGYGPHP